MTKTYVKLVDDGCHDIQHLGFPCIGHVPVVVDQNSLKERRNHVSINHVGVVRLFHVGIDQLQDLLFDGAKSANFGSLGGNGPYGAC
jgi:hypothetical protein